MRLNLIGKVPAEYNRQVMADIIAALQNQLNLLSEGVLIAQHNAQATVPTTGDHAVGDFVPKSPRIEEGSAGSKYIILGWVCSASPTTFLEARVLTGN